MLDEGTCNDSKLLNCIYRICMIFFIAGCGIPNCILCDKVDMICAQCQEGYGGDSGKCSSELQSLCYWKVW